MKQVIKPVKIWEESITIPTYQIYPPEKCPIFIENRAYQGSSGKVYPLPVTEKIADKKEDVTYKAVFLENDYLLVMILPELGGRIQRALDKTNNYDFIYYNHVIKPALVGLTGPWISGGIEFNWPQHHRPSTYSPVDYRLAENEDGSCSVFAGEIDKIYGTKGMARFTLYPDKAYIEIEGRLFNRTDTPQTFLWWANPAVPVNDNTYTVFPPDVHAVMDHGKRAVSTFPIATGEYYKYDYSAGIDISMYKNIKVPTSFMAAHSDFDFIGNYDTAREAGLLHIADHHISPGKKQWTWGNADFGRAWDRNLTDEDGPYIELMTGVFTDNQPDFTWLKPYEEKTFVQYFMPFKGVGHVKNATKDAMISFTAENNSASLTVYATGTYEDAVIRVSKNGFLLYTATENLSPMDSHTFRFSFTMDSTVGCTVTVTDRTGTVLVQYEAIEEELEAVPDAATPIPSPEELRSTEELYLAATHLEQYRHATYEPSDYYREGLKRDASDIRLNNGFGLLLFKRGLFEESIPYFQAAIKKQTWKNPNPYYGEAYFNLGLALEAVNRPDKAFDAFYKATWSHETQGAGFYWLACLSARKEDFKEALEFIDKSLVQNWHNMKARLIKAAILRILGYDRKAFLEECLRIDPLDMGCLFESGKLSNDMSFWKKTMGYNSNNYLELSLDYIKGGFYEEALDILHSCPGDIPLVSYYKSYAYRMSGDSEKGKKACLYAESLSPDYCFPNKLEEIRILKDAAVSADKAPNALYYLGNLYYDKKQTDIAMELWHNSLRINDSFSMVYRNLAIAYYNKKNDREEALKYMKKAYELEPSYPRLLLEYDQLCEKLGFSNEVRLNLLDKSLALVKDKDALYLTYITLLNNTGQYDKALSYLNTHIFHPWEGGEGRVGTQYKYALIQKAITEAGSSHYEKAIELLEATLSYPDNLGEGRLPNVQDNKAYYYMGICYKALHNKEMAAAYFKKASAGLTEPGAVLYYNDQPSDTIFYQGLAHEELGRQADARKCYHQLTAFGEKHIFDTAAYDYFAVSLPEIEVFPDNIQTRNRIYCKYLIALGSIGLGNKKKAGEILKEILKEQPGHQGAIEHLPFCRSPFKLPN